VILSNLATFPSTRSVARLLCDSWASWYAYWWRWRLSTYTNSPTICSLSFSS